MEDNARLDARTSWKGSWASGDQVIELVASYGTEQELLDYAGGRKPEEWIFTTTKVTRYKSKHGGYLAEPQWTCVNGGTFFELVAAFAHMRVLYPIPRVKVMGLHTLRASLSNKQISTKG